MKKKKNKKVKKDDSLLEIKVHDTISGKDVPPGRK